MSGLQFLLLAAATMCGGAHAPAGRLTHAPSGGALEMKAAGASVALALVLALPTSALTTWSVAISAAVTAAGAAAWWRQRNRIRTKRAQAHMVTTFVEYLIGSLRAGALPAAAFATAAEQVHTTAGAAAEPTVTAIVRRAQRYAAGGGRPEVILAEAHQVERFAQLGRMWRACADRGVPLATIAAFGQNLARRGDTLAAKKEAAMQGARLSARVLAVLPLGGVALGAAMGAHPLHFLLHSTLGAIVLCTGISLQVGGTLWCEHLINQRQQED